MASTNRWLTATALLLLVACAQTPREIGQGPLPTPTDPPPITVEEEPTPDSDALDFLLDPVREALARHDWMAAELALPVPQGEGPPEQALALWLSYYRARIALQRGAMNDYQSALDALERRSLPRALRREVLRHRLDRAELAGQAARTVEIASMLLELDPFSGANDGAAADAALDEAGIEARLWYAVQSLPNAPDKASWRSWWELARAANHASGARAAAELDDWLRRYPDHRAAARASLLLNAALADQAVQRPALLIPLTGPLGQAGTAVGDGLLASWYASPGAIEAVELLDAGRYAPVTAGHGAALARGADQIIGPLGKFDVAEVLAAGLQPSPLVLNRPENPQPTAAGSLQLSLAPEDEARQIARRAYADGSRHALLIRPDDVWGERMEAALLQTWGALGGELRVRAPYGNSAASHSSAVQRALDLDASAERSKALRGIFGRLETSGRRREDIDVIFLLCKSADVARSLRPQINYHYAGDLPVYALSTLDDGAAPSANRDLEGIRLPAMPWRLGNPPPGLATASAVDAFAALHALGADAWLLSRRQQRLAAGAGLRFSGYTAVFSVDANGAMLRELPMAEFDRGGLRRR